MLARYRGSRCDDIHKQLAQHWRTQQCVRQTPLPTRTFQDTPHIGRVQQHQPLIEGRVEARCHQRMSRSQPARHNHRLAPDHITEKIALQPYVQIRVVGDVGTVRQPKAQLIVGIDAKALAERAKNMAPFRAVCTDGETVNQYDGTPLSLDCVEYPAQRPLVIARFAVHRAGRIEWVHMSCNFRIDDRNPSQCHTSPHQPTKQFTGHVSSVSSPLGTNTQSTPARKRRTPGHFFRLKRFFTRLNASEGSPSAKLLSHSRVR